MRGITLIGMPGSGKSTVGKVLAERIGFNFLDLDIYIKEKEGLDVGDILQKSGVDALMGIEENYLLSVSLLRTVLAPYGSVVYYPRAMNRLKDETTIIFLKVSVEELRQRIGDNPERTRRIIGLQEKGWDDLYEERLPLYQKYADITIDATMLDEREVVETILRSPKFLVAIR